MQRIAIMIFVLLCFLGCNEHTNPIPDPGANGTVNPPALDSFSIKPWNDSLFDQPVHVYLSTVTPNTIIHYTLDGSYPTTSSPIYPETGIKIQSQRTLKAIGTRTGWINSSILVKNIRFQLQPVKMESVNMSAWSENYYDQPIRAKLASPSPNSVIRYTLDGSEPTMASRIMSDSGIYIDSCYLVKAEAFGDSIASSGAAYSHKFMLVSQPVKFDSTINLSGAPPFMIKLASPTKGAKIFYAIDYGVDFESYSGGVMFPKYKNRITITAIAADTIHSKMVTSPLSYQEYRSSLAPWNNNVNYEYLTDARDGQTYRTVQIDNHRWMAENLNFKTDSSWCLQNDTVNCRTLGRLYSWTAAMAVSTDFSTKVLGAALPAQGICPIGWHLPSIQELDSVVYRYGKTYLAASDWHDGMAGFMNDNYGFRAVFSGARYSDGSYPSDLTSSINKFFVIWSASEADIDKAWSVEFSNAYSLNLKEKDGKVAGLSIRCISD